VSVAIFFRDKRVQAAMSGPRLKQANALVDEFFDRFDYADCSVSQLLALADLSMRCGNPDVARQALLRVIETGTKLHVAHYKLGRLLLSQSMPAEAAAQFGLGADNDPAFPHNHMGAARALHAQGLKAQAAAAAERFLHFGIRPHGKEDLAVLGDLGDYLFDAGQRDRALPIYRALQALGVENPRHVVRLAEAQINAGAYAEALRMLLEQTARTGPECWSDRALAVCYSNLGDHETAIGLALRAVQADPAHQGFIGTYVQVLGKSGDARAIRAAMAQHKTVFTQDDVTELTTRLALLQQDPAAAAAALHAAQIMPETRLFYLSFEVAYAALNSGQIELGTGLADRLHHASPESSMVKVLRIDTLFRQSMWEEAGAILATFSQTENEIPQIAMKRLEYACFTGDRATAAAAAAELEALARTAGKHVMLPLFRYLAEQQDWNGIVDRSLPWMDRGLNYSQIGLVLFRAAKNSGRQAGMLAAIQAIPDWAAHAGLVTLRNNLAFDQARTIADFDNLTHDPALSGNGPLLRKIAARREVLTHATGKRYRQAVFLCTDLNYLCATFVALHSITRAIDPRHTDFFIIAEDAAVTLARASARAFLDANIQLTIVPASDIIGTAQRLLPEYGLFTSGHRLSSAAYYRIFFAQHLKKRGLHDRALYIDSDTLLTMPADTLLRTDLGGHALAARIEMPRPDVRRAITHHGLAAGRYFNSGVLLLDLLHPDLEAALLKTIDSVADETVTLLYHDQCALNLGFRDRFFDLDMAWNMPVTEATRLADIPPDAAILHFLDRPKPWSAAYNGEAGPLWFEKFQAAAAFIGEATAVTLFAEITD
jgi:lipopolysaccharide biosynthesis glycosyltransferase/predicted Zn-dependent protease